MVLKKYKNIDSKILKNIVQKMHFWDFWLSVPLKDKVMVLSWVACTCDEASNIFTRFIARRRYQLDGNSTSLPKHLGYRINKQRDQGKYVFLLWELQNFCSWKYTQRQWKYTWFTVQLGKYTRWWRQVHIVSVGSTYVKFWEVQSPREGLQK
jgi:hypothetical protein